jgi:hypothetical protein
MDYMFLLIGGVQVLMGSAFFGVSMFLALRRMLRMKKWTQTTGVVTDVEISRGMQQSMGTTRSTLYKPKVRYRIADGRVIDFEPQTSNSWSNYSAGQQIPVYYDPRQPENAMLGEGHWFKLIVFGVVGGFFAIFGAVFILINLIFPF